MITTLQARFRMEREIKLKQERATFSDTALSDSATMHEHSKQHRPKLKYNFSEAFDKCKNLKK